MEKKVITCEQYVVERIQKLEEENDTLTVKLTDVIDKYEAVATMYLELVNALKDIAELKSDGTSTTDRRFITFDNVWEKYDKDTFTVIKNALYGDDETGADE